MGILREGVTSGIAGIDVADNESPCMAEETTEKWNVTFESGTDLEHTRALVRGKHEILYDEPEFLDYGAGDDEYPGPVDNMIASLGACQISVLEQCLEKARIEEFHVEAELSADQVDRDEIPEEMPSNTAQRVRHVDVDLHVEVPEEDRGRARRCIEVYDAGCIVGQSFRAGIDYTPEVTLEASDAPSADD